MHERKGFWDKNASRYDRFTVSYTHLNPKEASVSIALTMIDNHVRATVVFTGSYADDQIPYRLDLNLSLIHI